MPNLREDDRVLIVVDGNDVEATLLGTFTEGTLQLAELETDTPDEYGFTVQYRPATEVRPAA